MVAFTRDEFIDEINNTALGLHRSYTNTAAHHRRMAALYQSSPNGHTRRKAAKELRKAEADDLKAIRALATQIKVTQ